MKRRWLPKWVSGFRDRHGKARYRFRRKGQAQYLFKHAPGIEEFRQEYQACLTASEAPKIQPGADKVKPGTFDDLIVRYYRSPDFLDPSPRTQVVYRGVIERWRAKYGSGRVADLETRHVTAMMAEMLPHRTSANMLRKRLSALMAFANREGDIDKNPVLATKPYRIDGGDVRLLGPNAIQDKRLVITQEKTKVTFWPHERARTPSLSPPMARPLPARASVTNFVIGVTRQGRPIAAPMACARLLRAALPRPVAPTSRSKPGPATPPTARSPATPPPSISNSCRTPLPRCFGLTSFSGLAQNPAKPQRKDKTMRKMVHPTGFEPVTPAFGGQYSIQLSYGCAGEIRLAALFPKRQCLLHGFA